MSHEYGNQSASNELRRRTPVHGETNANVADEIASRQVVQHIRDAQSTNNDELFGSASAKEHDYILPSTTSSCPVPGRQRRA
jgi:hypothetical protein